jgi:hypothetical protein
VRAISPWILVCTWGLTTAAACGGDEKPDDGPRGGSAGSGGQASGGTSQRGGSAGASGSGGGGGSAGESGSGAGGSAGESGSGAGGSAGESGSGGVNSSGSNAGGDSGSGGGSEGGSSGEWEGCPTADEYGAEAGPHAVSVTPEATYCATFDENRTLKQELAAKAMLRITPGRYALPGADRNDLGLPSCLRFGASSSAIPVTGGQATYTAETFDGTVTHSYQFTQTLDGNERRLRTQLLDRTAGTETPTFVLDGTEVDFAAQDFIRYLMLCPADGDCIPDAFFDSCEHRSARLHSHELTLGSGAGTVTFELRISESYSSTEPGAFVRASGTFRGTPFEQRDYWKLVYNPAHHHFVRNFAVIFDEPIDGACGIQVMGLEPLGDALTPDVAATVDCELNETGPLTVESHQHTVGPLP